MCAAPGTQGHLPDSCPKRASGQYRSEIDLFRLGNGLSREAFDHFRSHFITVTANTYATMHYNIARLAICSGAEGSYAGLKNAAGDPAPTGMDQGCGPRWRMSKVNGYTVSDGHREEESGSGGQVAVKSLPNEPSCPTLGVSEQFRSVNLVGHGNSGKPGFQGGIKAEPV